MDRLFIPLSLCSAASEESSSASEGLCSPPAGQRQYDSQHGGLPLQRPDCPLLPADQLPRQCHQVRESMFAFINNDG